TQDGAEVMNLNCLTCHGSVLEGEVVVGLGDSARDFTSGLVGALPTDGIDAGLLGLLGFTPAETANTLKMLQLGRAIGDITKSRTVGNNPAELLTSVLAQHRDPRTLAWSDAPLLEPVFYNQDGTPRTDFRFTSDPPPWWRAHKKNALFYNGMTRGPHRGTMEVATGVCVDNLDEAARVDGLFHDIQASVESMRGARYRRPIDGTMAAAGRELFLANCAGCHGTYADDRNLADQLDTYPNLLIPLDVVGTDPVVAEMGTKHAANVFALY